MLDLDHFKAVNDTHGHLCGDAVLAAVGQRFREVLRNTDTKCRYGREECMVLLPDTPRPGAVQVADSLRQQIGDLHVAWKGGEVSVTAGAPTAPSTAPNTVVATGCAKRSRRRPGEIGTLGRC